jgi:16S rRNA (guanine527-N7)-methyltransferase
MSQEIAQWRIPQWFPDLLPDELEKLKIYQTELLRWNQKINLISPGTVRDSDRIHFADSVQGCRILGADLKERCTVLDLGSGNGFPGVVLSILNSKIVVRCIDSDERKVSFIKQMSVRLESKNLKAEVRRIETLPEGEIEFATARALAPLVALLPLVGPKMKRGGILFCFKGLEHRDELVSASNYIESKWNLSILGEYELPETTGTRVVLRAERL